MIRTFSRAIKRLILHILHKLIVQFFCFAASLFFYLYIRLSIYWPGAGAKIPVSETLLGICTYVLPAKIICAQNYIVKITVNSGYTNFGPRPPPFPPTPIIFANIR